MPSPTFRVVDEPITFQAYDRYAQCVRFAQGGLLLITSGFDPHIKVWRCEDWSLVNTLAGHENAVNSLLINRDESCLFTTSTDATARQWAFPEGRPLRTFSGHSKTVTAAALAPDEHRLATASYDGRVFVFAVDSGALLHTLKGHGKQVTSVRYSPDGRWLASAGLGEEAFIWEAESGRIVQRLGGHKAATSICAWLDGGARLATVDHEGRLHLWQTDGWQHMAVHDLALPAVTSTAVAPTGDVVAACAPHTVAYFDANTWERLETISLKVKGVYSVAWNADGSRVAVACADGRVRVWQVDK